MTEPAAPSRAPEPIPLEWHAHVVRSLRDYFLVHPVGFLQALAPLLVLSVLLFTRSFSTNYIFDEQEALLANPYVNATEGLRFIDAIHRDFWGLPPERSIGSYRPIPNLLWRALWGVSRQPFFHHFYNVLFHAVNAALLSTIAWRLTRRHAVAWVAGATFLTCAVLTEAVSGIVGIADVLGGMGALLALLGLGLSAWAMPLAVFLAVLFGLFCKESALVCVPLLPFAALVTAPLTHAKRPLGWLRALLALAASATAFVLYVELRRRWFPSPVPAELKAPLASTATIAERLARDFLLWFHQAPLPRDPLNNPLALADTPHRVAGALRVYARGLGQLLLPRALSGDYSYPQEPVPTHLVSPESVAGAALMAMPVLAAPALWAASWLRLRRERRRAAMDGPSLGAAGAAVASVGLLWIVLSYFPHSNIPVVLPTVRAERFWYFPAIGSSLVLGVLFAWLHQATRHGRLAKLAPTLLGLFLLLQGAQAYRHAMDYRDDLAFWQATKNAVPNSAKAHLNYSVMKGARGDLETRLQESLKAAELAPQWAMARIYTGDTLCRMHRADEAWPHYHKGFELGPNELSLIALALQCLYDEQALAAHEAELRALAAAHEGTWIAYLAIDTLDNGATHKGVDPKHRPRGYNEGPKDKSGGE